MIFGGPFNNKKKKGDGGTQLRGWENASGFVKRTND